MINDSITDNSPILVFMDETGDIPKIYVNKLYDDEYMQKRESTFFDEDSSYILKTDCDVYTTDNKLLLKFRKNVIDKDDCSTLFQNMKSAAPKSRGRAKAAGIPENGEIYSYVTSKSTGKLIHQINTFARSGIVGYYDNRSFFGYKNKTSKENMCRTTAYTGKHMDRFQKSVPIFKKIGV